ncbi:cyclic nucleotide-binding domain-containing protein [Gammaproteobacteria bacterium]|nr:cyclic nucleotide-binding domain-containing protein [Gammaproteobacteria bacterium]
MISRKWRSASVIYDIGDPSTAVYFLLEGKIELHYDQQTIERLESGAHFGEIGVQKSDVPHRARAVAVEDCRLLELTRSDLHTLLVRYPAMRRSILQTSADRRAEQDSVVRLARYIDDEDNNGRD